MNNELFTLDQKIKVCLWFWGGNSHAEIEELFANEFNGQQAPCRSTIRRMTEHFKKHGCINSFHLRKREKADDAAEVDEDIELAVTLAVEEDSHRSIRDIQPIVDASFAKVKKILKKHKYKSYKIEKTNELEENDPIRRMEMCETLLEKSNHDENFVKNILFTDESSFPINGKHNPSVCRIWARSNPHSTYDRGTQRPQKLNV